MSTGDKVYHQIQRAAREAGRENGAPAPTQEYVLRHALESFLERLTRMGYSDAVVLKGGLLLAAYGARRPTKDVDTNIAGADVTPQSLEAMVSAIAEVESDDGVVFHLPPKVETIRDHAEYPGFRLRLTASIGTAQATVAWDVSTGDPIVPAPRVQTMPRVVGEPFQILAYAKETVMAEKGVTILQRGISSTRWRDYVDIVQLAHSGIDQADLLRSARAVARYREVVLEPVSPHLAGYGELMQAKWAAWRRRPGAPSGTEESLDAQVALVAEALDPVFAQGPRGNFASVGPGATLATPLVLPGVQGRAVCTSKTGRHRTRSGAERCPVHASTTR